MRLSRVQVPAPSRLGDMWRPREVRGEGLRTRSGVSSSACVRSRLRGSGGRMNSTPRRRAPDTHDCPLPVGIETLLSRELTAGFKCQFAGLDIELGNRPVSNLGIHYGHCSRRRTPPKTCSIHRGYPFSSPSRSRLGEESGNQSGIMAKAPAPGNVALRQTRFGWLLTPHLLTEVESLLAHRAVLISGFRPKGKAELVRPRDPGA